MAEVAFVMDSFVVVKIVENEEVSPGSLAVG